MNQSETDLGIVNESLLLRFGIRRERTRGFLTPPQPRSEGSDAPDRSPSPGWWDCVLSDPRAVTPAKADCDRALTDIRCEVLRVEYLKCSRVVQCLRVHAIRLADTGANVARRWYEFAGAELSAPDGIAGCRLLTVVLISQRRSAVRLGFRQLTRQFGDRHTAAAGAN
jgi:hypothetical protein